jgi:hypothetical protein
MAVRFTRMKAQGLGKIWVALEGRGVLDLVTECKEIPTIQALFRPGFIPPLLPISIPESR